MLIGASSAADFAARCAEGTACYEIGPFTVALRTDVTQVAQLVHFLYADFPLLESPEFIDHRMAVRRPRTARRWVRPYARFEAVGDNPFPPLPLSHAFPLLEWGFNWCVATTAHQFLMLHAGVVAKNDVTVILPALPGSGKSTLCAALVHRGWRLLSDEFALIRPGQLEFVPFPRCIPLKNESVSLIKAFAPDAVLGPTFFGTRKGDIAHMKPPTASALDAQQPARVTHVIFPHYEAGSSVTFTRIPKARAFIKVCSNAFNYEVFGADGFHAVGDIIDASECLAVQYSNLTEIVDAFDRLVNLAVAPAPERSRDQGSGV